MTDPESLDWNLFDGEYRHQLDKRQYVSPSRDRKRALDTNESNGQAPSGAKQPVPAGLEAENSSDSTKERATKFADDQDLEFDAAPSDEEDAELPEGSMFDYQVPGMLTRDEAGSLDLNHWRLLVRNALIDLEVNIH